MSLTLAVLMSAASYRIARFIQLDTMINRPRDLFHGWIANHPNRVTIWLQDMLTCPWCLTVWTSAAVTAAVAIFHPIPLDVLYWLGTCTGALVFWRVLDADD